MSLIQMSPGSRPPRFHKLLVADLRRETPDAVSIAFAIPADLHDDFRFAAGQYLTLRAVLDGEEIRRSYSICSGPDDAELRIAVKRVDGGAFSVWANSEIQAGDTLDVMTPTGRFGIARAPQGARTYAAFVAGSGITPVLSILRGILAREPDSFFHLFYGSRSTAEILFREALEELKDKYIGRLSVFHVLSREQQDIGILNGRLDDDKIRRLLRHMVPIETVSDVFLCGPAAMSEELEATLLGLGLDPTRLHIERFVSAEGGKPRPRPPIQAAAKPHATATLIFDGKTSTIPVAAGEAVLDAALRAGLDLPYACKGGMCSTCRAHISEGSAAMELNFSLEPWEIAAGFLLTCQARPTTPHVVIDYDRM